MPYHEGLRNVLPTAANLTRLYSPASGSYAGLTPRKYGNANEIPFYKSDFAVYNNAPWSQHGLSPSPAAAVSPLPVWRRAFPVMEFAPRSNEQGVPVVGPRRLHPQRHRRRVLRDNGFQPTYTSPFGSTFNDESNQPQMSGRIHRKSHLRVQHGEPVQRVDNFLRSGLHAR